MTIQTVTDELRRLLVGDPLTCEIHTNAEKLFFFVRLPEAIEKRLTKIAHEVVDGTKYAPEENDHVTLLYIPRFKEAVPKELRAKVIAAAKKIADETPPIKATLQGWGYFDGAQGKDDEPATAVVGLIDAPGLAHIHVELHRQILQLGINAKQNHGFTPHATFAYLPQGKRLPNLPVLNESFEIDEFELSNDRCYRFPLKGK